jgi:hypothetical protein
LDEAVDALTFDDDGFVFLSRHLAIEFCQNRQLDSKDYCRFCSVVWWACPGFTRVSHFILEAFVRRPSDIFRPVMNDHGVNYGRMTNSLTVFNHPVAHEEFLGLIGKVCAHLMQSGFRIAVRGTRPDIIVSY